MCFRLAGSPLFRFPKIYLTMMSTTFFPGYLLSRTRSRTGLQARKRRMYPMKKLLFAALLALSLVGTVNTTIAQDPFPTCLPCPDRP